MTGRETANATNDPHPLTQWSSASRQVRRGSSRRWRQVAVGPLNESGILSRTRSFFSTRYKSMKGGAGWGRGLGATAREGCEESVFVCVRVYMCVCVCVRGIKQEVRHDLLAASVLQFICSKNL